MRIEEAMHYLRMGYKIYQLSDPEQRCLQKHKEWTPSYSIDYLSVSNLLAEDWEVKLEAKELLNE